MLEDNERLEVATRLLESMLVKTLAKDNPTAMLNWVSSHSDKLAEVAVNLADLLIDKDDC